MTVVPSDWSLSTLMDPWTKYVRISPHNSLLHVIQSALDECVLLYFSDEDSDKKFLKLAILESECYIWTPLWCVRSQFRLTSTGYGNRKPNFCHEKFTQKPSNIWTKSKVLNENGSIRSIKHWVGVNTNLGYTFAHSLIFCVYWYCWYMYADTWILLARRKLLNILE